MSCYGCRPKWRQGDLNLGHSTRCRRNAGQVEAADGLVVVGHGALALQHVDLDLGLVVGSGAEDLALLGGDGGVGVDELGHHAAEGLDTQRQRCHVEQQHVLHLAGEHTALDGGADGDHLVGVDALAGHFAEELFDFLLHGGDTAGAADEDNLVDVAVAEASILHSLAARLDGGADKVVFRFYSPFTQILIKYYVPPR